MRILLLIVGLVLFAGGLLAPAGSHAQHCCNPTSNTARFAALGNQGAFCRSHHRPKQLAHYAAAGQWLELPVENSNQPARIYTVSAAQPGNRYLLVFHEWWGLNENIQREAERLAEQHPGVTVWAVDLYDGQTAETPENARKLMQALQDTRAEAILNTALAAADARSPAGRAQVATIGWCFGGGWALRGALLAGKRARACVIYYGMPILDAARLQGLECPVLGHFAEKDDWITKEKVDGFRSAMQLANKQLTVHWYNAHHAFANPSNPHHNRQATQRARKRTEAFLQEQLGTQ